MGGVAQTRSINYITLLATVGGIEEHVRSAMFIHS